MNKFNIISPIELIDPKLEASISLNPNFRWAKAVICDDRPNGNGHRIPKEEFDNIIKTGTYSPIKMASILEPKQHANAIGKAIGTHAQFSKDENRLLALIVLWSNERPEEVAALEEAYKNGFPPQLSWEISYAEEVQEENNIIALRNVVLDGTAVVDDPAYQGRTPIVSFASQNQDTKENKEVEDELKAKIATLEDQIKALMVEKEAADKELSELRTFKAEIESEKERAQKLVELKAKFADAGLEKDEAYFVDNADTLLKLDANSIDFMIQELVSFKKSASLQHEDKTNVEIPPITDKTVNTKLSPMDLGKQLRETLIKEK